MEKTKNKLIEELKWLAHTMKGSPQGDFFQAKVDAAKVIKVVPCSEVLTKAQIRHIKKVIKPKKKECYKNAMKLAQYLNCEYCEGLMFYCFGIDHAFNKVGDKYIDITKEFVLNEDPTKTEYITIGEYSQEKAWNATCEMGHYGEVFNHLYIQEHLK